MKKNKFITGAMIGGLMLLSVSSAFAQTADTDIDTENSTNSTTEVNQTVTDNSKEINVRCKFDNDQDTTVSQVAVPVVVAVNETVNQTVGTEQDSDVNVSSNQEGCNVTVNNPGPTGSVTNVTNNTTNNATTEVRTVERLVQVPSKTVNRTITVPGEVANTGR